jgi:hypothetical protein
MENIFPKRAFMFFTLFLISLIFVFCGFDFINAGSDANDTMIVEVNLLGFGNASEVPEVAIEVSDYVNLGDVTDDDPVSDYKKVDINNTGKVNITVTPFIVDSDEEIFKNLFFKRVLNDPWQKIGNWSLYIDKPATGSRAKVKYCYMELDLTNFNGRIDGDIIGHRAEVLFLATAG